MCMDDDRLQRISSITEEIYELEDTLNNYYEDELTGQILGIDSLETEERLDELNNQLRQINQDYLNNL